jgi:hypothetical protein
MVVLTVFSSSKCIQEPNCTCGHVSMIIVTTATLTAKRITKKMMRMMLSPLFGVMEPELVGLLGQSW